ncbi:PepSY-like domain-containing protein [Flavobacterium branchiicola]|uniref:PepSY-like domain-containing protein n=1 Tax=Flavobacterium branchiicola TaxID=1114875 RepID=A0ABV9PJX1_9FLAO|nr:PepSY-like domain-containing protein [Flavobacterium branchiicola]MBS7255657.1 PepSY-like domain-containing protein [Flavobacterium branchiicola]
MKKVILSGFIALSLLLTITSCDNDDDREYTIPATELPASVNTFITTYFPNATYQLVKKQKTADRDGSIYDVYLTNGFEIDFDANGNWVDIDGNHQPVPVELIPEKINTYVTTNYVNQFITSIDKESTHTEIELSSNIELIFDTQGNFVRIDK